MAEEKRRQCLLAPMLGRWDHTQWQLVRMFVQQWPFCTQWGGKAFQMQALLQSLQHGLFKRNHCKKSVWECWRDLWRSVVGVSGAIKLETTQWKELLYIGPTATWKCSSTKPCVTKQKKRNWNPCYSHIITVCISALSIFYTLMSSKLL